MTDEFMDRLRSGRVSVADARRAADQIEMLCMAMDGLEGDRKVAMDQLEIAMRALIWISKGGDGATVDDLRYVAEMAVAEVTA